MPYTILLVEDNYTLRRLYSRTLRGGGLEVIQANDIEQAREILQTEKIDAIVCDVQLTDGIAIDFMEDASESGIPTIAMSSDDSYRITADTLGIEKFLQKPIPTRVLVPEIKELLEKGSNNPKISQLNKSQLLARRDLAIIRV